MNRLHFIGVILMIFINSMASASPLFDLLFGNSQGGNYGRRHRGRSYTSGGGYNEYRRICRTINPDPYAFVGSNPYPAAPFCPP